MSHLPLLFISIFTTIITHLPALFIKVRDPSTLLTLLLPQLWDSRITRLLSLLFLLQPPRLLWVWTITLILYNQTWVPHVRQCLLVLTSAEVNRCQHYITVSLVCHFPWKIYLARKECYPTLKKARVGNSGTTGVLPQKICLNKFCPTLARIEN